MVWLPPDPTLEGRLVEMALRWTGETDDLASTLDAFNVMELLFTMMWHGKIDFDYTSFTLIGPLRFSPDLLTMAPMATLHTLLLTGV